MSARNMQRRWRRLFSMPAFAAVLTMLALSLAIASTASSTLADAPKPQVSDPAKVALGEPAKPPVAPYDKYDKSGANLPPPCDNYTYATATATIVPGTAD